jgi:predicted HAD superfamily phosphohydrolase
VFDPVFVKEVQYSGYEANETLGIVVPKKVAIKKYYTESLEERSLENLQTTQEITITGIELLD